MKENVHFVTNFNPAELDGNRLLMVSRQLGINAWIGEPINGMDGTKGFYVHCKVKNLTQFWDIILDYEAG